MESPAETFLFAVSLPLSAGAQEQRLRDVAIKTSGN
jgi:hypothetical protein